MKNILKVPYEVLAMQVDKMYPPHYTLKSGETIESHLMDIEDVIVSLGWTPEEYIEEYIHRAVDELFPNPREQN